MSAPRTKPSSSAVSGTWIVDRLNLFFYCRRLYRMLAKRWLLLLTCLILGLVGAAYLAWKTPNIYSASSRIGIAPRIQTAFTSQAQYLEELNNFYDSQLQYLTSSKVMNRVGERMLPYKPSAPGFSLVTQALKNPGSFSMIVESTDLGYARRFASVWAQEFISFKRELRESAIGRTAASTREEIVRYERSLEHARAALLEFQRKHNIGSIKETVFAAQQQLDKLEAEYQDIKVLRQRLDAKTSEEIASGITSDLGLPMPKNPGQEASSNEPRPGADPLARFEAASKYSELRLRIKTRQSEWDRLSQQLKPKHPYMIKLQQELTQTAQELRFQLDLIEEKRLARVRSLQQDEESYLPLIAQMRQQVLASRNIQYDYQRLQEDEANTKRQLDNLRKAEESLAATTIDEGLFHIIEEGVGSGAAVRPNRAKMTLAGLLLGLGVGLALVYLLDRLDDRFELAEEIEAALEEAVLGQVPLVNLKEHKNKRPLVTACDEQHIFAESLRNVRSSVLLGEGGPKQVLLLTSAVPGDGKTTLTVNFALTMAHAGHRVLLVDTDLRRGDTHSFFARPRDPGLADVLTGRLHWLDVLRSTPSPNLQAIHSGKLPPNPGELLASPIFREFLEETKKNFDFILLDCPPLTAIDDTFTISSLAEGVLFVVRSGQTSMRFARNALDVLRQRGGKILGLIVNGITADNPYYYYKNYYYSSYASDVSGSSAATAPASKMAMPKSGQIVALPETNEAAGSDGAGESPARSAND